MFTQKLVACIRHQGKVLREIDDTVVLPFGAEYEVLLTNLNNVRASVKLEIDGQPITDGCSLIIGAGETVNIERFIAGGRLDKGHRLKFIERTEKIEQGPRGIKPEDGLLRVTFEFEQHRLTPPHPIITPWHGSQNDPFKPWPKVADRNTDKFTWTHNTHTGTPQSSALRGVTLGSQAGEMLCSTASAAPGITVPGSISEQTFSVASPFVSSGVEHVMVLRLVGQVNGAPATQPITVKTKLECPTCGTKSKSSAKWCPECGTCLIVL